MKLHFLGANRQVTGSRYCLEVADTRLLIDCGMFQERPYLARNWEPCPVPANQVHAVLLTHAHIDHSGLLPKLAQEGFRGPIIATRPTVDLCDPMLRDTARILGEDAAYKKRRHHKEGRAGKYPATPLYTEADARTALRQLKGVGYQQPVQINPQISVVYHDAGHILGSAMLEVSVQYNASTRRLLFSGDIGQRGKPIIRDPSAIPEADYLVIESTYGDRNHQEAGDIETQLANIIQQTLSRGGKLVIPTFAVERAQELVYCIGRLVRSGRIPRVETFLDSPLAVDVTEIFRRHRECFDAETWQLIGAGESPLRFPGLHFCESVQESKAINEETGPAIIMAGSGMCTAGRIKHHLRQNIGRPESTILFVGYQGQGTLGRQILDGNEEVRIHGRNWPVRAQLAQIYGFSGHADRQGLLDWLGHFVQPPRQMFLTHGEPEAAGSLSQEITQSLGWQVSVPDYKDMVELT